MRESGFQSILGEAFAYPLYGEQTGSGLLADDLVRQTAPVAIGVGKQENFGAFAFSLRMFVRAGDDFDFLALLLGERDMMFLGGHPLNSLTDKSEQRIPAKMTILQIYLDRLLEADGRVVNAEVRIGDSRLHISEPWGGRQIPPGTHHASVYVEDADAVYRKALQAGALSIKEPSDMSWGDCLACVQDPSGIWWHILTAKRIVLGYPERYW
jgi:uncharacterized glyoxalase superfamily protein PhnB